MYKEQVKCDQDKQEICEHKAKLDHTRTIIRNDHNEHLTSKWSSRYTMQKLIACPTNHMMH